MCNCSICNKEFRYGDENSPMLKNSVWDSILEHYSLKEEEAEKEEVYSKLYDVAENIIRSNLAKEIIYEVLDSKLLHTYICTDCMEKALGRRLTKADLIGENIPFNVKFEKEYFK